MKSWDIEHAKLIGRIIFADFLQLPLVKYKGFIENVEASPLFEKLLRKGVITKRFLSQREADCQIDSSLIMEPSRVIAKIERNSEGFSIRYTCAGFNAYYLCSGRVYSACSGAIHGTVPIVNFLYKLRRINSRNKLTDGIIRGIITYQKEYLKNGDPFSLKPFRQIHLTKWLNCVGVSDSRPPVFLPAREQEGGSMISGSKKVDISWVSRLIKGISVITPSGEEKPLKWFFQTPKEINKRFLKQFLDKENEDIESIRLKKPLTDNQIRAKIEKEYSFLLSRRTVGDCRKDMGIPSSQRRLSGYKYPPLSVNFSMSYPLVLEEVLKNAPASPGVYEFRLKGEELEYPQCKTSVIYLGSARNLKKRLREHSGQKSKNSHIKTFLEKYGCLFRYIFYSQGWLEQERKLYQLFVDTYGAPPRCNRVRP